MKYSDFVEECKKTIRPECKNFEYLYSGLKSEIGEVFGKYKKFLRGDFNYEELREGLKYEIGDVLWYIAMIGEYCVSGERTKLLESNIGLWIGIDEDRHKFGSICAIDDVASWYKHNKGSRWSQVEEYELTLYLVDVAECFDLEINKCAIAVIEKLKKRKEENKICGDGDYR